MTSLSLDPSIIGVCGAAMDVIYSRHSRPGEIGLLLSVTITSFLIVHFPGNNRSFTNADLSAHMEPPI